MVFSLAVSFALFGSLVGEPTVAVLVIVPPWAGAVTTMVIAGADPGDRESVVQGTTVPLMAQGQPVPAALTKVTVAGRGSVTVIGAAAVEGPPLLTFRV